jgi:signal transduction histidine kinase
MNRLERPRGYQGSYLIGFILIGVVALRTILFYWHQSNLVIVIFLLAIYALLYALEPWLSSRTPWYPFFYFPVQTALVLTFSSLRPFLDFQTVLYVPLCMQAFRAFSRRAALSWSVLFVVLLGIALIPGIGLLEGLAFILLMLASGAFLISYDFLYLRTQADQAESQRLLANLESAYQKLQEQAAQADELAAARERNRLARELHDSVSQVIFSITLTSQSARLLLERDPKRVPAEIERLQEMTSSALNQLRSLIAELRPH